MVAVIAAMGGEIEGDRHALLTGGEVAAIEGIALLRRRKPRILPDRPGATGIHGGARPTDKRRKARQAIEMLDALQVPGRIERLDINPLRRVPDERLRRGLDFLARQGFPVGDGFVGHGCDPFAKAALFGGSPREVSLTGFRVRAILEGSIGVEVQKHHHRSADLVPSIGMSQSSNPANSPADSPLVV